MDESQIKTFRCEGECKKDKVLCKQNFYFKKDRQEYDKTCSECRRKQRGERCRSKTGVIIPPNESIEKMNTISRATEQSFPIPDKSDKDEIFKVFNLLKQWRDELQQKDPGEFKKIWQEVKDVSKR